MYEKANQIILHWDAPTERVKVAQFTVFGANAPIVATSSVTPPAFDGQWRWTDTQGRTQPMVTVFDGLMSPANPYLGRMDTTYKALALRLRDNQCMECHVPNNPDHSKRLVLLQTPMHAAGEIKRLMKSVREDKMPLDEYGVATSLDARTKAALLDEGAAFESILDLAKQWESGKPATTTTQAGRSAVAQFLPEPQPLDLAPLVGIGFAHGAAVIVGAEVVQLLVVLGELWRCTRLEHRCAKGIVQLHDGRRSRAGRPGHRATSRRCRSPARAGSAPAASAWSAARQRSRAAAAGRCRPPARSRWS